MDNEKRTIYLYNCKRFWTPIGSRNQSSKFLTKSIFVYIIFNIKKNLNIYVLIDIILTSVVKGLKPKGKNI